MQNGKRKFAAYQLPLAPPVLTGFFVKPAGFEFFLMNCDSWPLFFSLFAAFLSALLFFGVSNPIVCDFSL
jgi:hypothetical protein